jgi:hypothetical protein
MFAVVLAAFLADPSPDPTPAMPKGPAPMILPALFKDGKLVSEQTARALIPVTRAYKVIVNGREEIRQVTNYQEETRMVRLEWDLKKATFSEAGGKKIDLDTLKKRLAKPGLAVFSADGKPVDRAYLKLFAKDTLVIVAPQVPGREEKKRPEPPAKPPVPR